MYTACMQMVSGLIGLRRLLSSFSPQQRQLDWLKKGLNVKDTNTWVERLSCHKYHSISQSTRIFHITYHYFLTYACLHHFFSRKDKRKRKLLKNATAFLLMFLCSSHYFSPWLKAIQGWKIPPPPNSHRRFSKATRSIRFFFVSNHIQLSWYYLRLKWQLALG